MKALILSLFLLASPESQHFILIDMPNRTIVEPAWAVTDRIIISTYLDDVSFGLIIDGVYTDGKVKAKYYREHFNSPVKIFITESPVRESSYLPNELKPFAIDAQEFVNKSGGADTIYNHKGKAWQ